LNIITNETDIINSINYIKEFQLKFPELVNEMKSCSHNYRQDRLNPYHLEGDVFTHTLMVYNELLRSPNICYIGLLTGLLHDLGKLKTRELNEGRQRVSFLGHEGVSVYMAIDILNKFNIPKEDIITIINIIALHGKFPKGEDPFKSIRKDFMNKPHLILYWIQQLIADGNGRLCEVKNVEPLIFNHILQDTIYNPNRYHRNIKQKELSITLLVGPPNSGKSTYLSGIDLQDCVVISRDKYIENYIGQEVELLNGESKVLKTYNEVWDYLNIDKQQEIDSLVERDLIAAVQNNKNIYVDKTNMSKKSQNTTLSYVNSKYNKNVVVFLIGYEILMKRNKNRIGKQIKESIIIDIMRKFHFPNFSMYDNISYVL
jgi:predicted kinase